MKRTLTVEELATFYKQREGELVRLNAFIKNIDKISQTIEQLSKNRDLPNLRLMLNGYIGLI